MTGVPSGLQEALADLYDIRRLIGSGGMASVYAATDLRHQRQVACKVLDRGIAVAIGPRRFLREIRIAANLQHPHILPVFDSGQTAGWLYYVMPLVTGGTVRDRLEDEGPLSLERGLRLAHEVADALCSAHAAGIVHRDIKPENILLSQNHALLADFGIARREVSDTGVSLTGTGVLLGTPKYMSPEQVAGETVDPRSDMYSLGCVLYELLTGRPPFRDDRAAGLAAAHLTRPAPTLAEAGIGAPASVETLLEKALRKDPSERFRFMEAMRDAVAAAMRDVESGASAGIPRRANMEGIEAVRLEPQTWFKAFFEELRRRRVYRVAVAYIAVAIVTMEGTERVYEALEVPGWSTDATTIALLAGFPLTVMLAWMFDIRAGRITRTHDEGEARRWGEATLILSLLVAAFGGWLLLT